MVGCPPSGAVIPRYTVHERVVVFQLYFLYHPPMNGKVFVHGTLFFR